MKVYAVNDCYDLALMNDDGSLLDPDTMEKPYSPYDCIIARNIADDDPEEWERKARAAALDAGFVLGVIHREPFETWFEVIDR